MEILQIMLFDIHNGIKLENGKTFSNVPNIWKLNNTLLNNPQMKEYFLMEDILATEKFKYNLS